MKNLNNFIQEKLVINKHSKVKYNYHPKSRDELKELVNKLIEERGNEADLNDIDTSNITDMTELFYRSNFNGNISEWDVSNVEDMTRMFYQSKFSGDNGDISKWNTKKVKNVLNMFKFSPGEVYPPIWYYMKK